ncbi:MAG: hypothetical protein HY744_00830 [Deltaproteobacteria bacterium]|nr:hypothetical protein [Deltaproteobacteria bacterium]
MLLASIALGLAPGCDSAPASIDDLPAGQRPGGAPQLVALAGGATVAVPARYQPAQAPTLPDVERVHLFRGQEPPAGNSRLMVNELALQGRSCAERLDEEWKRMQAAQADADPAKLRMRRIGTSEQRFVAGHRVLYSESTQQRPGKRGTGLPDAAVASAMMCEAPNQLLIVFAVDLPELPAGAGPLLERIVASYRPPPPQGTSR